MTGVLFILKTPTAFIMMPCASFFPQEGPMVLVTPPSVAASVSSLQPGKWFVLARAVCVK